MSPSEALGDVEETPPVPAVWAVPTSMGACPRRQDVPRRGYADCAGSPTALAAVPRAPAGASCQACDALLREAAAAAMWFAAAGGYT